MLTRYRRRLKRALVHGRARKLVGPIYDALVALELRGQSALDSALGEPPEHGLDELTAVVKSFERPAVLRRLLESVRRFHPDLRIIVVDDSRVAPEIVGEGVELVRLPFDSGVSAGRAAGLARVSTELFLLLDDDFVFHRGTGLARAVARMRSQPDIDIMGGLVVDLPLYRTHPVRLAPGGGAIDGMQLCRKVPNFYVGRTERVRLVGWDPMLKRLDHADFFFRAEGTLTTVYNPELRCLHARTLFDDHYMAHRMDFAADQARIGDKIRERRRGSPR